MLIGRNWFHRIISLMLVVSILLMTVGCDDSPPAPTLSSPNEQVITENIEIENTITENGVVKKCAVKSTPKNIILPYY